METSINNESKIAIVGMSLRLPDADTPKQFFSNLLAGHVAVKRLSDEELRANGVPEEVLSRPDYVKAGAFVKSADQFDAPFFGFSEKAAALIDPQHRMLLECSLEALENAGYDPSRFPGWIGIYAGCGMNTYQIAHIGDDANRMSGSEQLAFCLSNDKDYIATRIAYKLNLKGPALDIQTACSTGLVATHTACQSLLGYECDMALSAAITLRFPTDRGYFSETGGIVSPDGCCRPFDAKANGTIFGNGCGVVVLKRLEDALQDRDTIYGVIAGSAINNDGAEKIAYSAPSVEGQKAVIELAQRVAGVNPEDISYVEAHGTGTSLGDSIEMRVLSQIFSDLPPSRKIYLGSVKGSVGHAETAAGMVSLLKSTLTLKNKTIPPTPTFESPNPALEIHKTPFVVNSQAVPFERSCDNSPRRVGVSSFGMGGTNCHMIIEEAPEQGAMPQNSATIPEVLLLSAKTETALAQMRVNLKTYLADYTDVSLSDTAYTLRVGRGEYLYRDFVVARDRDSALIELGKTEIFSTPVQTGKPPLGLLFPGQGSEFAGMANDLYSVSAVFKEIVDAGIDHLKSVESVDVSSYLFDADAGHPAAAILQPALVLVEVAAARMLGSLGIVPTVLIGHSLGEYAAAITSGLFSLEEGLSLVALRGRLTDELNEGRMLAVWASRDWVLENLIPQLSIAAVNAKAQVIVSGAPDPIMQFAKKASELGIQTRELAAKRAFHSSLIEPMIPALKQHISAMSFGFSKVPLISTVDGDYVTSDRLSSADYWTTQLRAPVEFTEALGKAHESGIHSWIESGPGSVLSNLVKQAVSSHGIETQTLIKSGNPGQLSGALGVAWKCGCKVDFNQFYPAGRRIPLPAYPFEHKSYMWSRKGIELTSSVETTQKSKSQEDKHSLKAFGWALNCVWSDAGQETADAQTNVIAGSESPSWILDCLRDSRFNISFHKGNDDSLRKIVESGVESGFRDFVLVTGPKNVHNFSVLLNIRTILSVLSSSAGSRLSVVVPLTQSTGDPVSDIAAVLRVARMEMPSLKTRLIEVDTLSAPSLLVRSLYESGPSDHVIISNLRRWTPTVVAAEMPPAKDYKPGKVHILLVGGLGGLGSELMRHLAMISRKACFTLLVREDLPERDRWMSYRKEKGAGESVYEKILLIQELESLGADLQIYAGDCTNRAWVSDIVNSAQSAFGHIDAAINLAGLPGSGLFVNLSAADFDAHHNAKVKVLEALACSVNESTRIIAFSSTLGWTGAVGHADYCAANAAMDALALELASHRPSLSIAWDAFSDVGLAARAGLTRGRPLAAGPDNRPMLLARTAENVWEVSLKLLSDWIVYEHRVNGKGAVPGTALVSLAYEALAAHGQKSIEFRNVRFDKIASLENEMLRLSLRVSSDNVLTFEKSPAMGEATAGIDQPFASLQYSLTESAAPDSTLQIKELSNRLPQVPASELFTRVNDSVMVSWGPRWNCVRKMNASADETLALLQLDPQFSNDTEWRVHPAVLDVALATSLMADSDGSANNQSIRIPAGYRKLIIHNRLPSVCYSYCSIRKSSQGIEVDGKISDTDGRIIVEFFGLTFIRIRNALMRVSRAIELKDAWKLIDTALASDIRGVIAIAAHDLKRTYGALPDEGDTVHCGNKQDDSESLESEGPISTMLHVLRSVLGQPRLGPDDDFFAFGGDSLLALQVATKAQQSGIQINPANVLEKGTARAMVAGMTALAVKNEVSRSGKAPLITQQRWFLSQYEETGKMERWFMCSRLTLAHRFDGKTLKAALAILWKQHDILRGTYQKAHQNGITEYLFEIAEPSLALSEDFLQIIDARDVSAQDRNVFLTRTAIELTQNFDISKHDFVRVALVDFGKEYPLELVAAAHHVAIDASCFGIFLQDFDHALSLAQKGSPKELGESEPFNFRAFALAYDEFVRSKEFSAEAEGWLSLDLEKLVSLPVDFPGKKLHNTIGSQCRVERFFPATTLVKWTAAHPSLPLAEIVRAAFSRSLLQWVGGEIVSFKMMSSGRFILPPKYGYDFSRAVGPFAFGGLGIVRKSAGSDTLEACAKQLIALPHRGDSAEIVVQHLGDCPLKDLLSVSLDKTKVLFNFYDHQSQFGNTSNISQAVPISVREEAFGSECRPDLLECTFKRNRDGLQVEYEYSSNVHRKETIENLIESFVSYCERD